MAGSTHAKSGQRTFSLHEPLPLTNPVVERAIDGRTVFIAPEIPAWITLDANEADVLRRIVRGESLKEILSAPETASRESLADLTARVIRAGFLSDRIAFEGQPSPACRVQIQITNRCNLRCSHCYMDSGVTSIPEASFEQWRELLTLLSNRYGQMFVSFSGGEPLVSRTFWPLIAFARSLKANTAMITNGTLLDERVIARLDSLLDYCAVSLDGLSSSTHDKIRGEGAFERTFNNLLKLDRASFRKVLNITVMRTNADEVVARLSEFVDALPYPVDVDLGAYIHEGRAAERPSLALDDNEFREVLDEVSKSMVGSVIAADGVEAAESVTSPATVKSLPLAKRRSCGYGDTLTIYPNGDLSPCLTPRYIRGNLFSGLGPNQAVVPLSRRKPDPTAFVNSPEPSPAPFNPAGVVRLLDELDQEREQAHVDRLAECKTCVLRYICGGQCHLSQLRSGHAPSQVSCPDTYKQSVLSNLASWGASG